MSLEDTPPEPFVTQPDQEKALFREIREKFLQAFGKLTLREQKLLRLWLREFSLEEIAKEIGSKNGSAPREESALKKED